MKLSRKSIAAFLVVAALTGCNEQKPQDSPTTPSTPVASASETPASSETPVDTATPGEEETPAATGSFEKSLELQDHKFDVKASGGEVTVTASGAEMAGEPQMEKFDGTIVDAETEDLDANGFPEVYIYVTNNDDKKSGKLIAFASNNGKSITPIYVPPLDQVEGALEGYRGGDEFRVVENRVVQRWSVYKEGDAEGEPSGGTRQVQWKLEPGEATWTLVVDKVENY